MFKITDAEKLRDAYTLLAFIRDDVPTTTAEQKSGMVAAFMVSIKKEIRAYCWVSVKQFSKNDTATACQDWLRSTRLGRGSIKSHVRTVKVLGMGLFAFQERIHLWKGVTH